MKEILIPADPAYLDAPDIACAPGGGAVVVAVRHALQGAELAMWSVASGGVRETWASETCEGMCCARLAMEPGTGRFAVVGSRFGEAGPGSLVHMEPGGAIVDLEGCADPAPVAIRDGRLAVAARFCGAVVAFVCEQGRCGDPIPISRGPGRTFYPSAAFDPATRELIVVWEQETPPGCGIFCRVLDADLVPGPVLRLDPGDRTAHVPCAAALRDGFVVTWHSPVAWAPPQWLVKDVHLALVQAGAVLIPEAGSTPLPGEEPRGEDQGFEFTVPVPAADGSIHVFGRSAHGYHRRILASAGWSDTVKLDEQRWGCRGPVIRAARDERGRMWTVTRERKGLAVRIIDSLGGDDRGAPGFIGRVSIPTGARPEPQVHPESVRDRDGFATWFGDIHQHSAFSDGTGAPHEPYVRARDFYRHDFAALTDHESFIGKRTPPGEWRLLQEVAERMREAGRFETLIGYEWTGPAAPGPGHKAVYLPRAGLPLVGREDPGAGTGDGLLRSIEPHGGIAIPHHVGWTGADEDAHRAQLQPCFEIVSCHGAYERADDPVIGHRDPVKGPFLLDLLRAGLRFGFLGGSDGHGLLWHHGVSRKRDAHTTGLSAVLSERLDRAAILDAIRRRRSYATSGVRMHVRVWVDGRPMGEEVSPRGGTVHIEVEADAGAPIARAILVLHSREVVLPVAGPALRWSDDLAVDPAKDLFVYLRLERQDGECAWTSPVFICPGE